MDRALRRAHDRQAAAYDRRWAAYVQGSLELLRPALAGRDAGDLLDLGCGTGALLPRLAAWETRVGRCVGVDPSRAMLRAALSRLAAAPTPRAGLAAAEAERLPLRDASFDTVVSASSFHDWHDPAAGLAEARRVLRPGGRLLLLDWSRGFRSMRLLDLWMRLTRVRYRRMYAPGELARLLEGAGFRVERREGRKLGPAWGLVLLEAAR
ncbi:MAG TPA: class I SAM-dependent methyltransferase [Longimicrobiaceae bacterium]|nr:class I SAM-dependent methyltransferase [Longimicrobiaceae bacterium]